MSSQLNECCSADYNYTRTLTDTVSLTCALNFNMVYSPEDHFCGLCQAIVCKDELTAILDADVSNEVTKAKQK